MEVYTPVIRTANKTKLNFRSRCPHWAACTWAAGTHQAAESSGIVLFLDPNDRTR